MNVDGLSLNHSGARIGIVLCLALALSSCASTTPNWDARFGETVNMAVAQQTLNPEASRNTNPVTGIDGRAGREAVQRYQKSFAEPEPPANVFTIGVSGGR